VRQTALCTIGMAFLCAFGAAPAQAQSRVFVAAQGLDSNACTFALPCRTFQHAHDVAAAKGEINVLDPAGYGSVIITKAISIQAHGFAGITVGGGGTGITINAGANDAVNLTGLIIEGAGVGQFGIQFNTGKSLTIESSIIRNLTTDGIDFNPSASSTLSVSDTVLAEIGNHGILVSPTGSGAVTATFNRVQAQNGGGTAFFILGSGSTGTIKANAADSVAINFVDTGFRVDASTALSQFTVVRSLASNGSRGVRSAGPTATVRLGQSTVTGNGVGLEINPGGAVIQSYADNNINGNSIDVAGALTPIGKQ